MNKMDKTYFLCSVIILVIAVKFCDACKSEKTTRMSQNYVAAGYSDDAEICKTFNENLLKVWDFLVENQIVEQSHPPKEVIHDVVLLLKAFIDHKNKTQKHKPEENRIPKTRVYFTKIVNKIKDIIRTNDKSVWISKIIEAVKNEFSYIAANPEKVECHRKLDEKLKKFTERAVEKYLAGNCLRSMNLSTMYKPTGNIYWVGRNACKQESFDDFIKIMKSIIQRYIDGSYCVPDRTIR